jgi:hypothetical protein
MASATCTACGHQYTFDPDRGQGLPVGERDGSPAIVCFPACPNCGKRNTAVVTRPPPPPPHPGPRA